MLLTTTITRLAESQSCDHLNRIWKTQVRTLFTLGVGRMKNCFSFLLCCRCRRVSAAVGSTSVNDFVIVMLLFSCLSL